MWVIANVGFFSFFLCLGFGYTSLNMYLVESYLCEREIFGLTYFVDFIFGIICIDFLY